MCKCEFYETLVKQLSSCLSKHNYKCPKRPKTISCKENSAKIKCRVESNEIACLFTVDPQHEGNCKTKNSGECLDSSKLCDFVLFFANNSRFKSVTFVELKGNKVNYALEQVKETIKAFVKKFSKNKWKYRVFAAIIYSGSAPKSVKSEKLKNLLDKYPFLLKHKIGDLTSYVKGN